MTILRGIRRFFAPCAGAALFAAALFAPARAHVEPIDDETLYEVTVVWTNFDLKNDGDGWGKGLVGEGAGDIVFVAHVAQDGHGEETRRYTYRDTPQLNFDDRGGRGNPTRMGDLLLYSHQQCHPFTGGLSVRLEIYDDDDNLLLRAWNAFAGRLRNAVIRRAKGAIVGAIFSGGNPVATAWGAISRARSMHGAEARNLVDDLAQRLGAPAEIARRAQNFAASKLEEALQSIPLVGDVIRTIDDVRRWVEERIEEILTSLYDTLLGWLFREMPAMEELGRFDHRVEAREPDGRRWNYDYAARSLHPPGIGKATVDIEIRARVLEDWAGTCRRPTPRAESPSPAQQPPAPQPETTVPPASAPPVTSTPPEPAVPPAEATPPAPPTPA